MASGQRLDTQFQKDISSIQSNIDNVDRHLILRVKQWIRKLEQPVSNPQWKKNRNNYAKLLNDMVFSGLLEAPFNRNPPAEPLPMINRGIQVHRKLPEPWNGNKTQKQQSPQMTRTQRLTREANWLQNRSSSPIPSSKNDFRLQASKTQRIKLKKGQDSDRSLSPISRQQYEMEIVKLKFIIDEQKVTIDQLNEKVKGLETKSYAKNYIQQLQEKLQVKKQENIVVEKDQVVNETANYAKSYIKSLTAKIQLQKNTNPDCTTNQFKLYHKMDKIQGLLIYQIIKFLPISQILLIELFSKSIHSKLIQNKSNFSRFLRYIDSSIHDRLSYDEWKFLLKWINNGRLFYIQDLQPTTLFEYNIYTQTSRQIIENIPQNYNWGNWVVYGNFILITGGMQWQQFYRSPASNYCVIDHTISKVISRGNMNFARAEHGCCIDDNNLYAFVVFGTNNTIEQYSILQDTWQIVYEDEQYCWKWTNVIFQNSQIYITSSMRNRLYTFDVNEYKLTELQLQLPSWWFKAILDINKDEITLMIADQVDKISMNSPCTLS